MPAKVIMGKPQLGTWTSHTNLPASALFPLPKSSISDVEAATLHINPPTAYRMLSDFAQLKPGDWVLQNGATSQVGLAVIQLAIERGIKTVNFVRDRPNLEETRRNLQDLGADLVYSHSELAEKDFKKQLAKVTNSANIALALNCVSGPDTTNMAKLLGKDATLVTYGAMSKQPLSLPSSLFIFKNLSSTGFWMTTWYKNCSFEERMSMTKELIGLIEAKKLKAPEAEVVSLSGSDEEVCKRAKEAIREVKGKKVIFKFG